LPQRTVTLRTSRPVPLKEVRGLLESVARANGLALVEEQGLLRLVSTTPEAAQPPAGGAARPGAAVPGGGEVRLFVHRLRHASAQRVAQTLRELFGLGGGFLDSGAERGQAPLSEALQEQRLAPFREEPKPPPAITPGERPQAVPAGRVGLAAGLQAPVQIVPDEPNNALLILATSADYDVLRAAIEQVDVRPQQVLIEVLIAEVRRTRVSDLSTSARVPLDRALGLGAPAGAAAADSAPVSQFLLGAAGELALRVFGIGAVNADVILSALASSSDVTVLSRPVMLAQNNEQARFLVGDQRPFIQLFRALPTDAAIRDQVVQYRNVGTQLTVRPTINADGYVTLQLVQEVSNATGEVQFGAPVISTREAETRLVVKDGHTVILGGLIDHQKDRTRAGIPLLKDLPLLGGLFGSTSSRSAATELFVFLTPHVITTDEDLDDATSRLRESTERLKKELPERLQLLPPRESPPPGEPDTSTTERPEHP
jgi:general secretion pathway protein D